jgi:hypothetical protein
MIGFALRAGFRMLALAGLLYVTFFVPLGPRTLYGHMARIAATKEAHELVDAVSSKAKEAADAVATRVKSDAVH